MFVKDDVILLVTELWCMKLQIHISHLLASVIVIDIDFIIDILWHVDLKYSKVN